jgi:predicted Fe-Mo cluster-binding NifX family protein
MVLAVEHLRRKPTPHLSRPFFFQSPFQENHVPATIYYEADADLKHLEGKTIAILGYGSQGHAQAQNLRDSGLKVVVAQRPGGPNYDLAKSHGFDPMSVEDAVKQADVINILLPDELQADVYRTSIRPNLKPAAVLMASTSTSPRWSRLRGTTRCSWPRRALAIWFAVNMRKVVGCPA